MAENILKLLYIIAGFIIMLMGLFNFFSHHRQYSHYYQTVQEISSNRDSWMVSKESYMKNYKTEAVMSEEKMTYRQLMTEIGGYYAFKKDVFIEVGSYQFQGIMSENDMQNLINHLNQSKKYKLKIKNVNMDLGDKVLIEIEEVKGN